MRATAAAIVVLLLGLVAAPAGAVEIGCTRSSCRYEPGVGTLSLRYPRGWWITDHQDTGSFFFVTNFRLIGNGHTTDGQFKIDVAIQPRTAHTIASLRRHECTPRTTGPPYRIVECRVVSIGGHPWVWMLGRALDGDAFRRVRTVHGNHLYSATGVSPKGSRRAEGLRGIREIFQSFRLQDGLPSTGSGLPRWLLPTGILLVFGGALVRRSSAALLSHPAGRGPSARSRRWPS